MISLDLETTGIDPQSNKIIEIGAAKFKNGKIIDKFQTFVNPECDIPETVTHITGITQEDTENAPTFKEILQELKKFIGEDIILGHNIQFDIGFLAQEGLKIENKTYDTYPLSMLLLDAFSYSLETLTQDLGIIHEDKHRALDDALAVIDLFHILKEKIEEIDVEKLEEIKTFISKSDWTLKDLFLEAKGKEEKTEKGNQQKPEKDETINLQLTERILEAFEKENLFLCEAGIGSKRKKSLLSAAAIQSKKNHERIVIAVKNRKEAQDLLELSDFKAQILQSYEDYISKSRLEKFKQKDSLDNNEITLLIKAILKSKEGQIDEFVLTREEREIFKKIACDSNECNHENAEMKNTCFFARAREQAIDADIIITDHEFLLSDHETSIPPYRYLIIDEAEKLEEAGTKIQTFVPEILEQKYKNSNPDMLFGLIGIFFEKFKNPEKFQLVLEEYHHRVVGWQNIRQSAMKISEELKEVFCEEYDPKRTTWIFQNQNGEICLKSAKIQTKEKIKGLIENKKSIVFISEILKANNSFEYIRKSLGIEENFEEETYGAELPKGEIQTLFSDIQTLQVQIQDLAKENKVAVLFTSQGQIKKKYEEMAIKFKDLGIKVLAPGLTGGYGKTLHALKTEKNCVLFCTYHFWNSMEPKGLQALIVTKVPFDHPEDPLFLAKSKGLRNTFNELCLPKAEINFHQALQIFIKGTKLTKKLIIQDSRITEKAYGKTFLAILPKN